jgi:glycosyltransferase involved in cell wall biosynthesis
MKPEARQWVKYAGTWEATGDEPLSYRIQRWWLGHRFQHGTVTVNGSWPDQPAHVISMHNPCLTVQELTSARSEALQKTLSTPLRIVFVGRLTEDKGIGRTLRIVRNLREAGIPVHLDVAGDDPARLSRESESRGLGLAGCVTFHGWASRSELTSIYRDAHIILLPSRTEGWPKVLSEAMAFGVVPVESAVGSVPQILGEINAGVALPYADERGMVVAIEQYWNAPSRWAMHSQIVTRAAMKFTYETYLRRVAQILDLKNRLDTQLQVASGG